MILNYQPNPPSKDTIALLRLNGAPLSPQGRTRFFFVTKVSNHYNQTGTDFFNNSSFSDFVVTCGSDRYDVSKFALARSSEYFRRLFRNNCKETKENSIDLCEDDPAAIKAMIEFCYTLDYATAVPFTDPAVLDFHGNVIITADKYDLPDLVILATRYFKKAILVNMYTGCDLASPVIRVLSTTPNTALANAVLELMGNEYKGNTSMGKPDQQREVLHCLQKCGTNITSYLSAMEDKTYRRRNDDGSNTRFLWDGLEW